MGCGWDCGWGCENRSEPGRVSVAYEIESDRMVFAIGCRMHRGGCDGEIASAMACSFGFGMTV